MQVHKLYLLCVRRSQRDGCSYWYYNMFYILILSSYGNILAFWSSCSWTFSSITNIGASSLLFDNSIFVYDVTAWLWDVLPLPLQAINTYLKSTFCFLIILASTYWIHPICWYSVMASPILLCYFFPYNNLRGEDSLTDHYCNTRSDGLWYHRLLMGSSVFSIVSH